MRSILKRPFAFWLPAFGLLFLLWAWVDSCYHTAVIALDYTATNSRTSLSIDHAPAALRLNRERVSGIAIARHPPEPSFRRDRLPDHYSYWWFPLPSTSYFREAHPNPRLPGVIYERVRRSFNIPYWCLVLTYLLCWAALHRQTRRKQKVQQAIAAAQTP